jgi:hypothetical protein
MCGLRQLYDTSFVVDERYVFYLCGTIAALFRNGRLNEHQRSACHVSASYRP